MLNTYTLSGWKETQGYLSKGKRPGKHSAEKFLYVVSKQMIV